MLSKCYQNGWAKPENRWYDWTFRLPFFIPTLLWLVVDWYDFLVVDILSAPFDKFYKMAKASPFEKSAVWFHCKASMRGMVLGLVFAPLVGLIVMILP